MRATLAMLVVSLACVPGLSVAPALCGLICAPDLHPRRLCERRCCPRSASPQLCGASAGGGAAECEQDQQAAELLDALEVWLRRQTVSTVLPREKAAGLLADLREDRRFWAQQRRQFTRVWTSIEEGMRLERRPVADVLGPETSARLLDALEAMEEDPKLVNAVLRSEVVESLLGHVLYEGIFEFFQRADLLGNVFNTLPIIGAIRMQLIAAAKQRLDELLGTELRRFLGEYTASAVDSAATFALAEDNAPARARARRAVSKTLLKTPVAELFPASTLEMALLRDSVWAAVQEFRLPNESQMLDSLYGDFADEPFKILLPGERDVSRGISPLFDRGRSVLHAVLSRFLASDDWREWQSTIVFAASNATASNATADDAVGPSPAPAESGIGGTGAPPDEGGASGDRPDGPTGPASWDGWD